MPLVKPDVPVREVLSLELDVPFHESNAPLHIPDVPLHIPEVPLHDPAVVDKFGLVLPHTLVTFELLFRLKE